jgi:RNA polymerase primary sigma factor
LQGQVSLDKKIGFADDSRTLADFIEDDRSAPPSLMATLAVLQNEIDRILASLTKREAEVIALRFGLRDNYPRYTG